MELLLNATGFERRLLSVYWPINTLEESSILFKTIGESVVRILEKLIQKFDLFLDFEIRLFNRFPFALNNRI